MNENPKDQYGDTKPQLALVPPSAVRACAGAFENGAKKYGPYNWRENRVRAMVYIHAAKRHLDAYLDGEDLDPESGEHHLGHVMACAAILIDAQEVGNLTDDRPGGTRKIDVKATMTDEGLEGVRKAEDQQEVRDALGWFNIQLMKRMEENVKLRKRVEELERREAVKAGTKAVATTIEPCVSCDTSGGPPTTLVRQDRLNHNYYYVQCTCCGVTGTSEFSKLDAISVWNEIQSRMKASKA